MVTLKIELDFENNEQLEDFKGAFEYFFDITKPKEKRYEVIYD